MRRIVALVALFIAVIILCCVLIDIKYKMINNKDFGRWNNFADQGRREPFVDNIKCKVINMKKNVGRWKHFADKFEASDSLRHMDLERIEAVDGADAAMRPAEFRIPAEVHETLMQADSSGGRTYHYELTKGAVGCYLSHVGVWEMLVRDNDCNFYVVFEDDALVPPNGVKFDLQATVQSAPRDWDVLLLGYIRTSPHVARGDAADFERVAHFWGTHAYVISKAGAAKALEGWKASGLTMQIDSAMSVMASHDALNVYALKNRIFFWADFVSDIQNLPVWSSGANIDPMFLPGFNYDVYKKI
jgi:GR25 family glycosyltransferase involved in LPS biosynthesis